MSDPSLLAIMEALAAQIEDAIGSAVPGLQVEPRMVFNPTPPSIDVYPADPFLEQTSFGVGEVEVFFNVRARVSTADHEAGQELLLDLMDPRSDSSVAAAIDADSTLGGLVAYAVADPPSGFVAYQDAGSTNSGSLLGCEWRTRVGL